MCVCVCVCVCVLLCVGLCGLFSENVKNTTWTKDDPLNDSQKNS